VPGIGPITATALAATIGDPAHFRSGRHFAAWLGLVPRQHASGGKERLGRISKRGDSYLRKLLIHGARTVMRWRRRGIGLAGSPWLAGLLERRPVNVTTVALANKNARIVPPMSPDIGSCGDGSIASCDRWAMMMRGESFRRPAGATAA